VWGPQAAQSKGHQNLLKNENLNKKSYFLGSKYFKLSYIKGNSINYGDLFLKSVISVRNGHCDHSA
jgi:hypothetical protein